MTHILRARQPVLLRYSSLDAAHARPDANIAVRLLGLLVIHLYIQTCVPRSDPDISASRTPISFSEFDVGHRPVNTRPQGRLGQRRARTRVIEPRNLNRFFDELIAKVGGSNPSGAPVFTLVSRRHRTLGSSSSGPLGPFRHPLDQQIADHPNLPDGGG